MRSVAFASAPELVPFMASTPPGNAIEPCLLNEATSLSTKALCAPASVIILSASILDSMLFAGPAYPFASASFLATANAINDSVPAFVLM